MYLREGWSEVDGIDGVGVTVDGDDDHDDEERVVSRLE